MVGHYCQSLLQDIYTLEHESDSFVLKRSYVRYEGIPEWGGILHHKSGIIGVGRYKLGEQLTPAPLVVMHLNMVTLRSSAVNS